MWLSEQELSVIAGHQPAGQPHQSLVKAAVAIILRDGSAGTEFLMMQRAHHEQDPWSGQMAFPGGKIDPQDESAKAAAIRETEEEVGLSLVEQDYIGQLDDLYGLKANNRFSVHVACFVFKPEREMQLRGNHEVADMVWVPFARLLDPRYSHDFYHPRDNSLKMPAVMINKSKEQILWGLSLRMLGIMFGLLGREMHVLTDQDERTLEEIERNAVELDNTNELTARLSGRRT